MRARGEALLARGLQGESVALSAQIPGSSGPLCEFRVEAQSEPDAQGERLRLRAHLKLRLRRPAGEARPATSRALPARVGRWIERRLQSRLVQTMAAPLLDRTVDTWLDLRASRAPLDEGSRALVPERLKALGIEPQTGRPLQTWAGALGGPRPGFAVLGLLRLDKDRLPAPLQQALGPEPFQLTATLANVVEED